MDLTQDIKLAFALLGSLIALISYYPYIRDIVSGKTKPHAFSWLVWGLLTGIAFFGQLSDGGGVGIWVTGITAVVCFLIVALSFSYGEKNITRSDWWCLILSLSAIPLWLATSTPLWSVILITLIDAVAFIPTVRKSISKPHEETLITYVLSVLKFVLGIIALENYSMITTLYPASLVFINGSFVVMVILCRRRIEEKV